MADTITVLSPTDIENAYLRTVRSALIKRGVASPNVSPNSDYAIRARALAQQIAVPEANASIVIDQCMPDTSFGEQLTRWLAIYGLSPRGAVGSHGNVTFSSSAPSFVAAGTELVDSSGQLFTVDIGATYPNGASIAVTSASTGKTTNHTAGDVLQWSSPPTYANNTVTVAAGGLQEGADADTEDTMRKRLLDHLRYTPGGGNWSDTVSLALGYSAAVQSAYAYPALKGPSTYGLWCLGPLTYDPDTGFSRQISDTLRSEISTYLTEKKKPTETAIVMPALGPNIADQVAHVAIGLTLSDGSWSDSSPWPALSGTGATYAYVSAVSPLTPSTSITISSDSPSTCPDPADIIDGTTQISWFDPAAWHAGETAIKTATITSHSGSVGSVTVYLDPATPFNGVAVDDFVFPACANGEAYAQSWMAAMGNMGPGEWTTTTSYLPRAKRHPVISTTDPGSISAVQYKGIEGMSEVLDVAYYYKSNTTPSVPIGTGIPPNVLVPGSIGFYPL